MTTALYIGAVGVPLVLAISLFRGGKLGTRWNQGGESLAQRDKRLRGDQP